MLTHRGGIIRARIHKDHRGNAEQAGPADRTSVVGRGAAEQNHGLTLSHRNRVPQLPAEALQNCGMQTIIKEKKKFDGCNNVVTACQQHGGAEGALSERANSGLSKGLQIPTASPERSSKYQR